MERASVSFGAYETNVHVALEPVAKRAVRKRRLRRRAGAHGKARTDRHRLVVAAKHGHEHAARLGRDALAREEQRDDRRSRIDLLEHDVDHAVATEPEAPADLVV